MTTSIYPWQVEIWKHLQDMRDRIPHALLFYGQSGTGMEAFADSFAKSLLCDACAPDGSPCGKCPACLWLEQRAHPDYRRVLPESLQVLEQAEPEPKPRSAKGKSAATKTGKEPSKKILLDQVASLGDFIHMSTHRGGMRIALIYPADVMTVEAANALLKMLEEPTPSTLFIIMTNHIDAMLPTIVSRCIKQVFALPPRDVAIAWLTGQNVAGPEYLLAENGGEPLTALAESEKGENAQVSLLIEELSRATGDELLLTAEKLQKMPMELLLTCYQRWLYDLLSFRMTSNLRYYPRYRQAIEQTAGRVDTVRLLRLMDSVNDRRKLEAHPLVARLAIEDLLLDYRKIFSL